MGMPKCPTVLTSFNHHSEDDLCDRCNAHSHLATVAKVVAQEELACAPWHGAERQNCDNCETNHLTLILHAGRGHTAACVNCGHVWFSPLEWNRNEP